MTDSLERIFQPITSAPPALNGITEIPPCAPLAPYVRCFWTGDGRAGVRVIPDICADIIIPLHEGDQPYFVGTSSQSFVTARFEPQFGIRFYAWAVPLFLHADASLFFDSVVPAYKVFGRFDALCEKIRTAEDIATQIAVAQPYLLSLLGERKFDSIVMNTLSLFVKYKGHVPVIEAARHCAVSKRSLERHFLHSIGTSPKQTLELVRYQLLWQNCCTDGFDVSHAIEQFGFYDQSHLCDSFKARHGVPLKEALAERRALAVSHFSNTSI